MQDVTIYFSFLFLWNVWFPYDAWDNNILRAKLKNYIIYLPIHSLYRLGVDVCLDEMESMVTIPACPHGNDNKDQETHPKNDYNLLYQVTISIIASSHFNCIML